MINYLMELTGLSRFMVIETINMILAFVMMFAYYMSSVHHRWALDVVNYDKATNMLTLSAVAGLSNVLIIFVVDQGVFTEILGNVIGTAIILIVFVVGQIERFKN